MTIFEGYTPHPHKLRNPLLQNAQSLHGAPPTTEELLALQDELNGIKAKTSQRLQKATADLGYFQAKWTIATKGRERPKDTSERPRHKLVKERVKREVSGQILFYPSETAVFVSKRGLHLLRSIFCG